MKKILFVAIAAFIYTTTAAQLSSNLIVNAQPPAQLSEWGNRREVLVLIVSAPGAVAGPFKLKTEIKLLNGAVIASADLAKTPVYAQFNRHNHINCQRCNAFGVHDVYR